MSELEGHVAPQVHLLSNGSYHVMLTDAGAGYSRWKDLALTRWREDATCDNWGAFCYVRDLASGAVWSATLQPTVNIASAAETVFAPGRAVFNRSDGATTTQLEIAVSPQDDVELRRLRITNRSLARREFAVTSYAEIVLAPAATDAAHRAFSKLFLQTEIVREHQAILCTRRPRAPDEPTPWWFHLLTSSHPLYGEVSYETDRMRFIGRGRSTADPQALDGSGALGGSEGAVLDAVAAIRCCFTLEAGESASVDLITGVSETRTGCLGLIARLRDRQNVDRVLGGAPAAGREMLDGLQVSETDARLYNCLAGAVIYAHAALRAAPSILLRNSQGQSGLWAHGISGDLPIVLLRLADPENLGLMREGPSVLPPSRTCRGLGRAVRR